MATSKGYRCTQTQRASPRDEAGRGGGGHRKRTLSRQHAAPCARCSGKAARRNGGQALASNGFIENGLVGRRVIAGPCGVVGGYHGRRSFMRQTADARPSEAAVIQQTVGRGVVMVAAAVARATPMMTGCLLTVMEVIAVVVGDARTNE